MSNKLKYSSLALLSSLLVACSGGGGSPADNGQGNGINPQDGSAQAPVFHLSLQPLVNSSSSQDDEMQYKQEVEKLLVNGNQLLLLTGGTLRGTDSAQGDANDDVGLHLVKNNIDGVLSGLGKIKNFGEFKNGAGTLLLLRDPEANGWQYQSFGRYSDTSKGKSGYFSFGEQSQHLPTSGKITYEGIAWGDAKEKNKQNNDFKPINSVSGELAATLQLTADFDNKTIDFKTTNTKGYQLNGGVQDYAKFDLTGTAKWDNGQKSFVGTVNTKDQTNENGTLKGSFYGPNALEVGGTFGIKTEDKFYQGGFGGKQVKPTENAGK